MAHHLEDPVRAPAAPAQASFRTASLAALAMVAFAANSILCRLALATASIDPAMFTLVRILSGAAVLWLVTRATGRRIGGSWGGATALLVYAAGFSFAYVALTAATGALILFGAVQATMIASGLAAGERLGALQWAGLAAAVAGLVMLLIPGLSPPDPIGAGLMATAGIAWGIYSLIGRGASSPLATTAGNFVRAVPMALPLLLLSSGGITASGLVLAVASGAAASGIGYALWYAVLPSLAATRAATLQLSVPVLATIGAVMLLGEAVSLQLLAASAAVLGGIAIVIAGRRR